MRQLIWLSAAVIAGGGLCCGFSCAGAPGIGQSVAVDGAAALSARLKVAKPGEVIRLRPGTYSGLGLSHLTFSEAVTITSADPAHQAVLTNFNMTEVNGMTFRQVEFFAQQPSYVGFNVYNSQNIAYDRVSVHGSLDGNPANDPAGIRVFDSSKITLISSEFQQLEAGFAVARSSDIVVSDNTIHDMGSDGLDFAQVSNLKVTGNVFHDFHPSPGDHPDAIQFMTTHTTAPSQDITIADNLIYRGAGGYTQGIFMGDELGNMPFQHVTISNNVIVGTGYSAIRPTHNTDLTITGNTLVSFAGDNDTYLLVQDSDQVVATNNQGVSIGISKSTHVAQRENSSTRAVSDHGAQAVREWMAAHPRYVTPGSGSPH